MSNTKTNLAEVIDITEERFVTIAPQYMKYDAEKGFAIQQLKANSYIEKAARNNPASLQQAITNVAAIGLSLNPAEKLAYLIPRGGKVYLEPSYMGLIRLATDSGSIEWIQAKIVRKADIFTDNGMGEKPTHTYNAFDDRGDIVGCYATAKTAKGDYLTSIMDIAQIESIRNRSESYKAYKSGVWVTDFEEMAKKAVIRNLFKTLPRTDERRMALAVHMSNENEGFEPIKTEPNYVSYTDEQKEYFDQLIEKGDALEMFVFLESFGHDASSDSASVLVSLHHSFPKGSKGKYQKIVEALKVSGEKIFNDYMNGIRALISNEDEIGLIEICQELGSDNAIKLVEKLLTAEEASYFSTINIQE